MIKKKIFILVLAAWIFGALIGKLLPFCVVYILWLIILNNASEKKKENGNARRI